MDLSHFRLLSKQMDCHLYCDRDAGLIYQEWLTTAYGEKYRDILMELLEIQRENGVSKLIVNGKELGQMDEEDIEWTQHEYSYLSVDAGLRYIAFIVSDDDYHAMQQADVIIEAENEGVTSNHFSTVNEAYAWIMSK